MNEDKKKAIERLEKYVFLIKSLKENKIEDKIDEKYQEYLNLAKKEVINEKAR